MPTSPFDERSQRPRPGARILGPGARYAGPYLLSSPSKSSPGTLDRTSIVCRTLLGVCIAYLVIVTFGGWGPSHRQTQKHTGGGMNTLGSGRSPPLVASPGAEAVQGLGFRSMGGLPSGEGVGGEQGRGREREALAHVSGSRVLRRQDQFLRKPQSTIGVVIDANGVTAEESRGGQEPHLYSTTAAAAGQGRRAVADEEYAADEREFAMHIQAHARGPPRPSLLKAIFEPPKPSQLWLERLLEGFLVRIDRPVARRASVEKPVEERTGHDCQEGGQGGGGFSALDSTGSAGPRAEVVGPRGTTTNRAQLQEEPCQVQNNLLMPPQEPDACRDSLGIPKVMTALCRATRPGYLKGLQEILVDFGASQVASTKIALMFLTRGKLHHEAMWRSWFDAAAGLLPLAQLRSQGCDKEQLARVLASCTVDPAAGPLKAQHLFNVYVHVSGGTPDWRGFARESIFHGREIPQRLTVKWGKHSMVDATRALLAAALADRSNLKFVLLSESGVPLYSATTLYAQLMAEDRSRINACAMEGPEARPIRTHVIRGSAESSSRWWDRHPHRWVWKMRNSHFEEHHWRKSSQWWALTRIHAQAIVTDVHIDRSFRDHCYSTVAEGWWRDCFSDEHYFASLLAALGRDNETDCKGFMMHVDWSKGGAHPRAYKPKDIDADLFRELRLPGAGCAYPAAIKTALEQFVHVTELDRTICRGTPVAFARTLGPQCPLFARKFPPDTVDVVAQVLTNCSSRLRITHGLDCPWEDQQQLGQKPTPDATPPVSLSLKSRHLRSQP